MWEQSSLESVHLFVRVVDEAGFSAAARSLGLPKSTVSRRVSELEAHLGVRLLQRTTRRVRTTDVGQAYYERARRALTELFEADRIVRNLQIEPSGMLRITAPADFPADVIAQTVCEYTSRYPQVSVYVEMTQRVVDLIEEGFDLAIRAGRMRESSLIGVRVGIDRIAPYASPDYLDRHGGPGHPEELTHHDCLVFGSSPLLTWRLQSGSRVSEVQVKGKMSSNDFAYLTSATIGGAGIALLPGILAHSAVRAGRLRRVLPAWSIEDSGCYIVYPSSRHLAASARAFIDLARTRLGAAMAATDPGD